MPSSSHLSLKMMEEEKMTPVLTVTKNNAILKNIFIILQNNNDDSVKNRSSSSSSSSPMEEQTLVVGRHPNCHVKLEHPSISRFHCHLISDPSSCRLYVRDLSSVHGTWVMGKKIEPGLRVELNEGDTMKIGGSSRVYRLHRVPLSRAYDIENPFISPSDVCGKVEDKNQLGFHEDENDLFVEDDRVSLGDHSSEESSYIVSDENSRLSDYEIPSPPPPFFDEDAENKSTLNKVLVNRTFPGVSSEPLVTVSETETSCLSDEIPLESENQQSVKAELSREESVHLEQNADFLESVSFLFSHQFATESQMETSSLSDDTEILTFSDEIILDGEKSQFVKDMESSEDRVCIESEKNADLLETAASLFSQQFGPESETLPDEILLENKNSQYVEDKKSTEDLLYIESEQNADLLESVAFLFRQQFVMESETGTSSLSDEISLEVENPQVVKDQMSTEDFATELEQNAEVLESLGFLSAQHFVTESETKTSSLSDEILLESENLPFVEGKKSTEALLLSQQFATESESETSSLSDEIIFEVESTQFVKDKKSTESLVFTDLEQNADVLESLPFLSSQQTSTEPETETSRSYDKIIIEGENPQAMKDEKSIKYLVHTELEQNSDVLESLMLLFSQFANESNTETLSSSDKMFLKSENQHFVKDEKRTEDFVHIELEHDSDLLGSLPFLFSGQYDEDKTSTYDLINSELEQNADLESLGSLFTHEQSQQFANESVTETLPFSSKTLSESKNKKVMKVENRTEDLVHIELEEDADLLHSLPFLFSEQYEEDKTSAQDVIGTETEQKADLESFVSLFSHEHSEFKCSIAVQQEQYVSPNAFHESSRNRSLADVNFLREIGSPQSSKENERQKEKTGTPHMKRQFSSTKFSLSRGKQSRTLTIRTGRSREMSKMATLKFDIHLSGQGDVEKRDVRERRPFTDLDDGSEEAFTPNRENRTLNTVVLRSVKRKEEISMNVFTDLNEDDEPFTPDKENFTPKTLLVRSMLRMCKTKDFEASNLPGTSLLENIFTPSSQERILLRSSSKNQTNSKTNLGIRRSTESFPLGHLFGHSSAKSKSESSAQKSSDTMNFVQVMEVLSSPVQKENLTEGKRKWHMVADSTTLLNNDSREALQLLRGIKGTVLIIPRTVIRELERVNQQGSLFRMKTQAARALQWIKECPADADWWIHIHNSEKEAMHIPTAATPPTSAPRSGFSYLCHRFYGEAASVKAQFSAWVCSNKIVSPSAEDGVLECALQYRREKNDVVLLSGDVHLKIKAMAEGLPCETAEEFRKSLVNPFSERSLWKDSTPRGLTWSCMDDVALKEIFYGNPIKTRGECIKGLKLVLLQNDRLL